MIKIRIIIPILIVLIGCNRPSVKLPTLSVPGITDTIYDNSQIWIFFEIKDGDTTAVLNRKNSISTTNWIFNIDRRLPMKLIAPHINYLTAKREKPSLHFKDADDYNYFSYVNTTDNLLSLVKFETLYIKTEKPKIQPPPDSTKVNIIINQAMHQLKVNNDIIKVSDFITKLNQLIGSKQATLYFFFNKNISYSEYLNTKAILQVFNREKVKLHHEEYMYE